MENQNPSEKKALRPFTCNVSLCNQSFQAHKDLIVHLRLHRASKQYKCYDPTCLKIFSSQSCLKKHERIHNGEKPYRCGICKQSFTQVSNLRRHERVHKGEKPYECNICKKKFSTSSNHKQHMLVHQEKDDRLKFWCEKCNTSYYYKASLKKHLKTHQEDNIETESSLVEKSEEVVAPVITKKLFVSPITNITIPDFNNQEMLQEKKRRELLEFWELNSSEYLKTNPFALAGFSFPQLINFAWKESDSKMQTESSAKLDYAETKELSDTLSQTSKSSKDKSTSHIENISEKFMGVNSAFTLKSASFEAHKSLTTNSFSSSFGAGIRIPIPIRPKKC
eukprot:CAMPEP_0176425264 /NCGR_PEP_ID=MMETSP0127-20121128/11296_1 /TAXON_ID=938130 /ORGANISM="Platyophrya macrostoma, Strain WH" /LENGTH=335 /DNA_ID=CAMNT_0017806413 /DNA_START=24 /DNA_END=1031 /DNA_ORIENTATION=+